MMDPFQNSFEGFPEPPLEADVTLEGYARIDIPIDWLWEDWALALSPAAMGVHFRLFMASLRQSPSGSLPSDDVRCCMVIGGMDIGLALSEALTLWPIHADGRRYWDRSIPLIEAAWARKRGKSSKDGDRKQRERLWKKLVEVGCTETGARNRDVQDAVLVCMQKNERLSTQNVLKAAQEAGVIGNVKKLSQTVTRDSSGQSQTVTRDSSGQSQTVTRDSSGQSHPRQLVPDNDHTSKSSVRLG